MSQVEADGLLPFTNYWYQFKKPLGSHPAPAADDDISSISLGIFSCANWQIGYFNAYGNAARKDNIDDVAHLGD
ncbi:hypothetical protein ACHAQH_007671 [Verticillium albo-atrum]